MNFDQLVAWFRSTSFGESWPPWGPLCLWQCFILSLWSFAFAYFCAEFQFDSFEIQQKDGLCQVLETRVYKNITIWEILPSAPDQFDHFLWGVSWPFFRVSRRLQIIGADCCPCTDSRVERGAAFLAKVDVPTPTPNSASPAPRPRALQTLWSHPSNLPSATPALSSQVTQAELLPGYLRPGCSRERPLDKSAPLGQTCKACDSI